MNVFRWMMCLVLLTGCVTTHPAASRMASASAYLCKHCNCFMPADVPEGAICPVCKCGYPAHACHRGQ